MESAYTFAENILYFSIHWATLILEFMGVIVLIYGGIIAFLGFCKHKSNIRLTLAQNMALALEFKMGGEILQTVVSKDWTDLLQIGLVILLRAALSLLIHWDIVNEQKETLSNQK